MSTDQVLRRVDIVRVAKRRWRLVPVARNGARFPGYKTYVTLWNAKRATRRQHPGVPFEVIRRVR